MQVSDPTTPEVSGDLSARVRDLVRVIHQTVSERAAAEEAARKRRDEEQQAAQDARSQRQNQTRERAYVVEKMIQDAEGILSANGARFLEHYLAVQQHHRAARRAYGKASDPASPAIDDPSTRARHARVTLDLASFSSPVARLLGSVLLYFIGALVCGFVGISILQATTGIRMQNWQDPLEFFIRLLGSLSGGEFVLLVIAVFWLPLIVVMLRWRSHRSPMPAIEELADIATDLQQWRATTIEVAERDCQRQLAAVERSYRESMAGIAERCDPILARVRPEATAIQSAFEAMAPAWISLARENIPTAAEPLTSSGIGRLLTRWIDPPIILPALVPFPLQRPLLLVAGGAAKYMAVASLQSVLLRMLVGTPPGKLRFILLDPLGLGQNVASLMHLADHDEQLVTSRAWTEARHVEQRLVDLTEHIENVIQKYLRDQYPSIEAYNEQAGEIAEPYRVLVVFDFPVNFSQDAARRLLSIAQSGPRCGVLTVIHYDPGQPAPHGFNIDDLQRIADTVVWDGGRFVWQDDDFRSCLLTLDTPPEPALAAQIVEAVGKAAKELAHVEVPFERIAPPADQWWQESSLGGLNVTLGPSGARAVQRLNVGTGTTHNALIAGRVGSGKSTLLHTLIANLALTYSPDEVELYLIDFKEGVEFKTYAARQLPHARVIAIESEREFGLSVLQGLDAEIARRGSLFKATADRLGVEIPNIATYRARSSQPLPRILLLVDEFQKLFAEDDSLASQAANVLENVVRTGRAFGIHVVLASQTLAGTPHLNRAILGQMAIRIALQCSDADSRLILADDNPQARLLSRPGEAIYNGANGLLEGNNRFQVAWLSDEVRDAYLERIRQLAEARGYQPARPQIVFEGTAPADVAKNAAMRALVDDGPLLTAPRGLPAWLGEPVAIRDSVAVTFRSQGGSNLLIVGQDEEAALGVTVMAATSVAARLAGQVDPGTNGTTAEPAEPASPVDVLDFSTAEGTSADAFTTLAEALPSGLVRVGRRRQLAAILARLSTEVKARIAAEDEGRSRPTPPRVLIVFGLQRARDLRPDDGLSMPAFSFSAEPAEPPPASPSQDLATILRDGPDVGIHTIVWCDTMTSLNRGIDRRALREFGMRLAFQMSADDSSALIDTTAASKLGRHRALLFVEDEGRLEKLRPYGLPDAAWLSGVGARLRARASAATPSPKAAS